MGKHLLYIQLSLLLLLFYLGNLDNILANGLLTIPFFVGFTLALWAFYNMGSKNFSPFPEPKVGGKFVQAGIYTHIRHPMYTGLILVAVSLFLSELGFITFFVLAIFMYVIDEKASLEEKLLTKIHSEYKNYQQNTKKFIPRLY